MDSGQTLYTFHCELLKTKYVRVKPKTIDSRAT